MQDHKIIVVIKEFDKATCKRFKLFLNSPYHNPSERVRKIGEYLLSFYPHFDHASFSEEAAFAALGVTSPYSKHELTRYLSKLFFVVEDFLAVEGLQGSALFKNSLIANYYFEQNNSSAFHKTQKLNAKLIKANKQPESAVFFYDYLNKKRGHNFHIRQRNRKAAKPLFLDASKSLNDYHAIQVLTIGVTLLQVHKEKPNPESCPMIEPVLQYVQEHIGEVPLLVRLWYFTFRLLETPTSLENYRRLKQELRLYIQNVPPNDARNFTLLLNATLTNYTSLGRQHYLEERFDNYLIEMQEGWLTESNIIEYKNFNNIITIALALGRVGFTESFLEKYKIYLAESSKNDILAYNKGHIAFHKGNFSQCLSYINQTSFLDSGLTLAIKRLQAMCFYELGEKEQFFNTANTMKVYIHRLDDKLKALKSGNSLFCKVLLMLDKNPDHSVTPKSKASIEKILKDAPFLPDAEWIIKVLNSTGRGI